MLYFLIERKKKHFPFIFSTIFIFVRNSGRKLFSLCVCISSVFCRKKAFIQLFKFHKNSKTYSTYDIDIDVGSTFFKTDQKFNSFTFFFPQKTTIRVHKYTYSYYNFCSPMTEYMYFHDLLIDAPTSVLPVDFQPVPFKCKAS